MGPFYLALPFSIELMPNNEPLKMFINIILNF